MAEGFRTKEAILTSTCVGTSSLYRVAAGFLVGVTLAVVGATMSAARAADAASIAVRKMCLVRIAKSFPRSRS